MSYGFATVSPIIGLDQQDCSWVPDTTQRFPLGMRAQFIDPFHGAFEAIYLKASAAHVVGQCVYWTVDHVATLMPHTGNVPYPAAFAKTYNPINTYGWYVVYGACMVAGSAEIDVGVTAAVTTAGYLGASAQNDEICGIRIQKRGTGTYASNAVQTYKGLYHVDLFPSTGGSSAPGGTAADAGWWIGGEVRGTGVGTDAEIGSVSADGKRVVLTVVSTATALITDAVEHGHNAADSTHWMQAFVSAPYHQGADT